MAIQCAGPGALLCHGGGDWTAPGVAKSNTRPTCKACVEGCKACADASSCAECAKEGSSFSSDENKCVAEIGLKDAGAEVANRYDRILVIKPSSPFKIELAGDGRRAPVAIRLPTSSHTRPWVRLPRPEPDHCEGIVGYSCGVCAKTRRLQPSRASRSVTSLRTRQASDQTGCA